MEPKELTLRKKDGKLTLEGRVVDATPVGRPFSVVVWTSDYKPRVYYAHEKYKEAAFKNAFERNY